MTLRKMSNFHLDWLNKEKEKKREEIDSLIVFSFLVVYIRVKKDTERERREEREKREEERKREIERTTGMRQELTKIVSSIVSMVRTTCS